MIQLKITSHPPCFSSFLVISLCKNKKNTMNFKDGWDEEVHIQLSTEIINYTIKTLNVSDFNVN